MPSQPIDNDVRLDGRVALITGAGSGLGLRFARVLARAGAAVALAGRRLDRLTAARDVLANEGHRTIAVALDVRDESSIAAAVAQVEAEFGVIDILINNAGVAELAPSVSISADSLDTMLDTNVRGPFLMARAVGRRLIESEMTGRIVNISSIAAYHCPVDTLSTVYSVTKSAVLRMTECLAMEWAEKGINVNAIAPGLTRTEMLEANAAYIEQRLRDLPRRRIGDPSRLDSSLLYLVAPQSDFVTGICLRVDDAQTPR